MNHPTTCLEGEKTDDTSNTSNTKTDGSVDSGTSAGRL